VVVSINAECSACNVIRGVAKLRCIAQANGWTCSDGFDFSASHGSTQQRVGFELEEDIFHEILVRYVVTHFDQGDVRHPCHGSIHSICR